MKFYTCGEQIWVLQNVLKRIQQGMPYSLWSEFITEKAKISLKMTLVVGWYLSCDRNSEIHLSLLLFTILREKGSKFSGGCWSLWLFQWQVPGKAEIWNLQPCSGSLGRISQHSKVYPVALVEISSSRKLNIALIASASSVGDTARACKRCTAWKSFYFQKSKSANIKIEKSALSLLKR